MRVTLTITWALLLLGLGAITLIVLFIALPDAREVLRYVVAVLATAGGLAGAYYVGRGLRSSAQAQKVTRTFAYPARFGDPSWAHARVSLGNLIRQCLNQPEGKRLLLIEAMIENEENFQRNIIAVLNFFEELALAANLGLVNEQILDRFYRTTIVRGYGSLAPWVKKRREQSESPRLWVEVEALFERWRQKA